MELSWMILPQGTLAPPLPQTFKVPALAWDYGAMTRPIDSALVEAGATLRVDVEALSGSIGVSLCSSDGSKLLSTETPLEPYEGRVQVDFTLKPRMGEVCLLVRNYNADDEPGEATVYSVEVA